MDKQHLEELVAKVLDDKYSHLKQPDGTYYCELYADYRDSMDAKTAIEILTDDRPRDRFHEIMSEYYFEAEVSELNEVIDDVKNILETDSTLFPEGMSDDDEEVISEKIKDTVYVFYPEDHYLKQEFYVNIGIDTGDGNYDYTPNATRPSWYGQYTDELNDVASIRWLAYQQGYTKTQLWDVLTAEKEEDLEKAGKFLRSMRQEVANIGSGLQQLTFLVKMTLEECMTLNELIKLQDRNGKNYDARKNPYCGYIVLDKSTETGLFDTWNGGGSLFEIELEKDVLIPISFIEYALPDSDMHGYSISSVYGMCGSAWRDTLKKICGPEEG